MKSFVFASIAIATSVAFAQSAKPLSVKQIPLRADAPLLFAPRGWQIEKRISGDLNRDKIADAALVLVEKPGKKSSDESGPSPRSRALVVLLREGKGWHRVGFSNQLLLGTRDGGAFYGVVETPVDVSIQRGVLIVSMESGSRDVGETTHRFRLDRKKRVFLIGFDSTTRDRLSGNVEVQSANFLTGTKKTTTIKGESDKSKTTVSRVSKRLRTLESLKEEERYKAN